MGDGTLGLLFEIAADPSKGEAALGQMQQTVSKFAGDMAGVNSQLATAADASAKHFTDGAGAIDKSLLSNHQSVHLLAEEMGIHLPRAVVSAISELLPSIGAVGPALLGAFAVEGIVKFAGEVRKLADDFNQVKEAQKVMQEIASENVKLMEEAARKSEAYARQQIRQLGLQIVAGEAQLEALRREHEGLGQLNPVLGQIVQAYDFWLGGSKDVDDLTKKLVGDYKLLGDVVKIVGENEAQAHEKAAKASKKALNQEKTILAEFAEGAIKGNQAMWKETVRQAQEGEREEHRIYEGRAKEEEKFERYRGEAAEAAARAINKSLEETEKALTKLDKRVEASGALWKNMHVLMLQAATDSIPPIQKMSLVMAEFERIQTGTHQVIMNFKKDLADMPPLTNVVSSSLDRMASATIQAGVAAAMSGQNIAKAMEQALKSTLTSIASEAAVRALYNLGLGFYYLAIQDYPDADLAFSAAAVFGSITAVSGGLGAAIPGGGKGGAGARGGPGGNQSTYGSQPGSGGGQGPGGGGGGSRGPTIVMNMYGPLAGSYSDLARALTPVLNQLGTSGQIRLTSYNSLTSGAKQT